MRQPSFSGAAARRPENLWRVRAGARDGRVKPDHDEERRHKTPAQAVEPAITSRRATRAFLPTPVDPALLHRLIEVASRAPSGTNMQPWKLRVIGPQARARLESALLAALD
ncbi:MAG: nitroreductase family protein, partial [Bosea sp. (in: a-proteobacteria)]|nr:nitroreductase family protein [Bosea sp. (in: a-proteobacteria)]